MLWWCSLALAGPCTADELGDREEVGGVVALPGGGPQRLVRRWPRTFEATGKLRAEVRVRVDDEAHWAGVRLAQYGPSGGWCTSSRPGGAR